MDAALKIILINWAEKSWAKINLSSLKRKEEVEEGGEAKTEQRTEWRNPGSKRILKKIIAYDVNELLNNKGFETK
jgi:hypothetical protein